MEDELLVLGAQKVVINRRFYYVSQIGDPVPRPIEEIRAALKAQDCAQIDAIEDVAAAEAFTWSFE